MSIQTQIASLLQTLTDDETIAAGTVLVADLPPLFAATDPISQQLLFNKLAADVLAAQVTVRQELQTQLGGQIVSGLQAAIAAAKARQAAAAEAANPPTSQSAPVS
jgi:hypothetical protein